MPQHACSSYVQTSARAHVFIKPTTRIAMNDDSLVGIGVHQQAVGANLTLTGLDSLVGVSRYGCT